jgi:quercetin dioxygenase-like cupin family protein
MAPPTTQGKQRARSGDVVDIKNDEWHWHGATKTTS